MTTGAIARRAMVEVRNTAAARETWSRMLDIINALRAPTPSTVVLQYRLNGGPWHDRPLNAGEIDIFTNRPSQGSLGQMIDVAVSELVPGDNTLEFVTVNYVAGLPAGVSSIDLVLATN